MNTNLNKEQSNSGYNQYKENRIENHSGVNRRVLCYR